MRRKRASRWAKTRRGKKGEIIPKRKIQTSGISPGVKCDSHSTGTAKPL